MLRLFLSSLIVIGCFIAPPALAATDVCNNPYFSMKPDSRIEYQNTNDGSETTLTLTEAEDGSTAVQYIYPDHHISNLNLSCSDRTIVSETLFDFLRDNSTVSINEVTGAFFPADVQLGSTWATRYDLNVPSDDEEVTETVQVELNHCAISEERIAIPAGTFNALKVRVTGYSSAPLDLDAMDQTGEQLIRYDLWLVKGIGIVKIQYKEPDREDVIVATDIQIGNWLETAAKVAAPAIVGVAVANAAIATQATVSVDLGRYLWFFITEPLLFFKRRRRKAWGVAYNALTRLPEDLVIVRVRDAASNKIIASEVTDREGRFSFFMHEGRYTLEAAKAQFEFPSRLTKHKSSDAQYADLYHGESVKVKSSGLVLTPNIPIDPKDKERDDAEMVKKDYWHKIQEWVAISGPVIGIVAFAIQPTFFIGAMLVVGLIVFLFFRRFATTPKPKALGYVLAADSGHGVSQAIVRLFTLPFNKLADYKVTDMRGRYHLRVGNCQYYLTVTKNGFKPLKTKTVDDSKSDEPRMITERLKIQKQ